MENSTNISEQITELSNLSGEANYKYAIHERWDADRDAEQLIQSLRESYSLIPQITDWKDLNLIGVALGRYLEGDHYDTYDEDERAEQDMVVGLTHYFLTKAIKAGMGMNAFGPEMYRLRFSTSWEYNKSMMSILSHARGESSTGGDYSDPMTMVRAMTSSQTIQIMYLSDALAEPRLLDHDKALKDIFWEEIQQYDRSSWPRILKKGKELYDELFEYLTDKINQEESDF
jgi:hypothetical protein